MYTMVTLPVALYPAQQAFIIVTHIRTHQLEITIAATAEPTNNKMLGNISVPAHNVKFYIIRISLRNCFKGAKEYWYT